MFTVSALETKTNFKEYSQKMSYETFWCVVLLGIFTSCAVFERKGRVKTQTMSKNAQWYYTPKRLKIYLLSTSLFHAHF